MQCSSSSWLIRVCKEILSFYLSKFSSFTTSHLHFREFRPVFVNISGLISMPALAKNAWQIFRDRWPHRTVCRVETSVTSWSMRRKICIWVWIDVYSNSLNGSIQMFIVRAYKFGHTPSIIHGEQAQVGESKSLAIQYYMSITFHLLQCCRKLPDVLCKPKLSSFAQIQ